MRNVCEIKPEWLYEVAPHYYTEEFMKTLKASVKLDFNKF